MRFERRRSLWIGLAAFFASLLAVAGALLPLPFVELGPGPTFDVLGKTDGKPLLQIDEAPTYPTGGTLDITTVNERGGADSGVFLGRVVVGWLRPEVRIVPREALYPDDVSQADVNAANVAAFSDSQSNSIAASMSYLHKPIRTLIVVAAVTEGTPAWNQLDPGDQIVRINNTQIHTMDDVDAAMSKVKPGESVVVDVIRDAKPVSVHIVTTSNPQDSTRAFLGIEIGESYRAEFPITVNLEGVGGPSGGLMLSLGIVDKLTPGELNGGKLVAGTGTIDPDGKVGAIGGIEQKMAGARGAGAVFFLAPAENCADVRAAHIPSGLTVAKVSTLSDAVSALESYVAGKPVVGCS